VAYEFKGSLPDPARFQSEGKTDVELKIRKPSGGHSGH
jgi:hypothetical protein